MKIFAIIHWKNQVVTFSNLFIIILFFPLLILSGCTQPNKTEQLNKTEFKGQLKIVLVRQNAGDFSTEYYLKEDSSIYYLKFLPNIICEGLTKPYSNQNCFYTKIGNFESYINSNSTYLISGDQVGDSGKLITYKCNLINVKKIKEISRDSGTCMGYMGSYTERGLKVYASPLLISCNKTKGLNINASSAIDLQSTADWAKGEGYIDIIYCKDIESGSQEFFMFLFMDFFETHNDEKIKSLVSGSNSNSPASREIIKKLCALKNMPVYQIVFKKPITEKYDIQIDGNIILSCDILLRKKNNKISLGLEYLKGGYLNVNAYKEVSIGL